MNSQRPDKWHTGRLQEWLSDTGAIRYEGPSREIEEERRSFGIVVRGGVYSDSAARNSHREGKEEYWESKQYSLAFGKGRGRYREY